MRSNQYRASPASIYIYWWVDRSTCLASRISTEKESFPGSEFKPASIWTCWMLIDRQMQSAFMPELHRWISKLTARHLHHQEIFWSPWEKKRYFVQKMSFEKWKKVVSLIDLKVMKTRNDCEIACDCVKRANVVLHVGLCKESSPGSAQLPTSRHLLSPFTATSMTYIHLTRWLVAMEPPGLLWQT